MVCLPLWITPPIQNRTVSLDITSVQHKPLYHLPPPPTHLCSLSTLPLPSLPPPPPASLCFPLFPSLFPFHLLRRLYSTSLSP